MADLTKNQRRYLSRFSCSWCEMPLHHKSCGAIGQQCSEEVRAKRREQCLAGYKPRPTPEAKERTPCSTE